MHAACTNSKCELRPSCGRSYLSVRSIWARPVRLPTGEMVCGWKIEKDRISQSQRLERESVMAALSEARDKLLKMYKDTGSSIQAYKDSSDGLRAIITQLTDVNPTNP